MEGRDPDWGFDPASLFTVRFYSSQESLTPAMLHSLRELLWRQSIQDISSGQPSAPCLQDAVADFIQMRSVMRIGVDDDLDAALLGLAQVYIIQIEPVGVGVQLHRDFMLRCRGQDRAHVEVVSIAAKLQPAGGMAND